MMPPASARITVWSRTFTNLCCFALSADGGFDVERHRKVTFQTEYGEVGLISRYHHAPLVARKSITVAVLVPKEVVEASTKGRNDVVATGSQEI